MAEISQATVDEVERLKGIIGWGWGEISTRFGWGPPGLAKFRALKSPIEDDGLRYLREVAAAVESVPGPATRGAIPTVTMDETIHPDSTDSSQFITDRLRQAGMRPGGPPAPQEISVMLLDDIAAKLAIEYRSLIEDRNVTPGELDIAKTVLRRVARRLGVGDRVRGLLAVEGPLRPASDVHSDGFQGPSDRGHDRRQMSPEVATQARREAFLPNAEF